MSDDVREARSDEAGDDGAPLRIAVVARAPALRAGLAALLAGAPGLVLLPAGADEGALAEVDVLVVADPRDALAAHAALDSAADADAEAGSRGRPAVVLVADPPPAADPQHADAAWTAATLRAGVRAVVPTAVAPEALAAAIRAAAAGLVTLPRDLAAALAAAVAPPARAAVPAALPTDAAPLTPRELQVLTLLADGLPNKAIAPRLGISEHTVKAHVAAVFAKLGAGTRTEAVATAVRQGVLML